jgi:AcrR family transcriptional regulator
MRDGTKKAGARRGRPRLYDPEQALDAALEVFWMRGLTGTSLDHLVEATGMNRPSLYNAFGDKEAIYRQSLARFTAGLQEQLGSLLEQSAPVQEVVERFYLAALDVYCAGDPAPGCFVMCTAPVETAGHPEVR